MNNFPLHIVSFNVPWPADYGGVIDVYYRLKALAEKGIRIRLHCFQYGREESPELAALCEKIYYYPRRSPLVSMTSGLPYIVSSRGNVDLLNNLLLDRAPILFEGLHCCYYLPDKQLENRMKVVRLHNVEWQYYSALSDIEPNPLKEWYFLIESWRLRRYENIVKYADHVLTISPEDTRYYDADFDHVMYLPAFHSNSELNSVPGRGSYCLYHGNLSVSENIKAAAYLIDQVFGDLDIPLIIAGRQPSEELLFRASASPNIEVIADPTEVQMEELIREAHIHVLPTFQNTGIKLKLINALFQGRYCLVNQAMVENTGLEDLCSIAESPEDFKKLILSLMKIDFTEEELGKRRAFTRQFSNTENADLLIRILYAQNLQPPAHPGT